MNWAIEQGWAEYWGTSEWPAPMIMNAIGICDKLGLIRPVVEQVQYNMLVRARFEVEYGELFDNFKMGSTIWSPLAGGMLSGKYIDEIPNDSRVGKHPVLKDMYYTPHMGTEEKKKATVGILKGLKEFCKELGCTMSQLGIAWSLKNNDVSSCLIGVNNMNQLEENFKSMEIAKVLDEKKLKRIEEILNNRPQTPRNWKSWQPFPCKR